MGYSVGNIEWIAVHYGNLKRHSWVILNNALQILHNAQQSIIYRPQYTTPRDDLNATG